MTKLRNYLAIVGIKTAFAFATGFAIGSGIDAADLFSSDGWSGFEVATASGLASALVYLAPKWREIQAAVRQLKAPSFQEVVDELNDTA